MRPICAALAMNIGMMRCAGAYTLLGSEQRAEVDRLARLRGADAVLVAYFDFAISAFAFARSPWSPELRTAPRFVRRRRAAIGHDVLGDRAGHRPPHASRSAALSMTQLIARRTCTSSNGGWVRFIAM